MPKETPARLVDVLGEVAGATNNLGSGEKAAKFNEVFGLLGITAASAIGKSVADTRKLYDELRGVQGIASQLANSPVGVEVGECRSPGDRDRTSRCGC